MPKRSRQLTGQSNASQRSKTRAWKVSALKINENKIPEESTVTPSTSSDSASTRSNGALSTASKTRPKPVIETSFQKQNCDTNETPRADQSKYEKVNKTPTYFDKQKSPRDDQLQLRQKSCEKVEAATFQVIRTQAEGTQQNRVKSKNKR
jgi:hypothetical protein